MTRVLKQEVNRKRSKAMSCTIDKPINLYCYFQWSGEDYFTQTCHIGEKYDPNNNTHIYFIKNMNLDYAALRNGEYTVLKFAQSSCIIVSNKHTPLKEKIVTIEM